MGIFLYGIIGGAFAELLGLFKLRHQAPSEFPAWLKSPFYWIVTVCMVLAGGVLTWSMSRLAFNLIR